MEQNTKQSSVPVADTQNRSPQKPTSSQKTSIKKHLRLLIVLGIFVIVIAAGILSIKFLMTSPKDISSTTRLDVNDNPTLKNNEPNPKIEILAKLPPEDPRIIYNILFDPNRHVVYGINKDQYSASSSSTVVIDGKTGRKYSETDGLTTSPNGKRVAYIVKQADKEFVVVDGMEGKKYDYIKNLKFSPDSQRIAYAAGEEKYFQPDSKFSGNYLVKRMFVVIDSAEGKIYDGSYVDANIHETYDPFFSKDGKKITYSAIKNGKNIIVVNDKEIADFTNQLYPQFIGNTYNVAYLASENSKYFLVSAGKKKNEYDYISDINYPAYYIGLNASQIGYQATDNNESKIVVNDISYPITSGVLQNMIISTSAKYVAYYTGTWMSKNLFVNGQLYDTIQPNATTTVGNPLFSPNEQLLVYSEYNQKEEHGTIHILSTKPLRKIIDVPMTGFKIIGDIKFSDDGKYLYFKGWQDRKIVFVTINIEKLTK